MRSEKETRELAKKVIETFIEHLIFANRRHEACYQFNVEDVDVGFVFEKFSVEKN